jgi:hypothetical protein|tara:strand:+ start:6270 stop:8081 length:1812 start_codon:yes stop_codon:yes gene_type:complete
MAETKDIKYINRDFNDFKKQLMEFAKAYFPDSYNDFSPTSPGMMFIEQASYVGDVLSFYQDNQLQETFLQHAKNPANLYSLAYMLGYKPKVTTVAETLLEITQNIDAIGAGNRPNFDQAITISENSTVKSTVKGNTTFLLQDKVDFSFSSSYDPTEITVSTLADGAPSEFQLKKHVRAFSGKIQTIQQSYSTSNKFATFEINDENIISILDIKDSDGNEWYEVPFLGQDTIFVQQRNTSSDKHQTPNLMKLKSVPRRFVTRFTSKGVMQVQFGAGISTEDKSEFLPTPSTVQMNTEQGVHRLDYAYDPSNFMFTKSYGLAPSNTTLTVRYLTGGGIAANSPANTITGIDVISTSAVDTSKVATLAFNNPTPATGGRDGDTVQEIRENASRSFSEQKRAVTLQDYTIRTLSIPPEYGSVAKAYVTQEASTRSNRSVLDENRLALALYVLAYNNEGQLIPASPRLKDNIKTYLSQYMLLTDAVDIKDAFVINIGVQFEVISLPNYQSRDVLLECNLALQKVLGRDQLTINQPLNLSELYTTLDRVKGVQTVKDIKLTSKSKGKYSEYGYDIAGATKNNVVYPSYDPCCFEVKYPNQDIVGRVTTL